MRILILFLSFLLASGFVYAEDEEETVKLTTEYLKLSPKFTVNLDRPRKYLAVDVQLLLEGDEFIEKVKKHQPLIRHELIMLFSGRPVAELQTMEQREALRQETKDVLSKVLSEVVQGDGFKDIFFTELLVN